MEATEKITEIGNISKFLIEVQKNTEKISMLFNKGYCGEAVTDTFKTALDTYQRWLTETANSLNNTEVEDVIKKFKELEECNEKIEELEEEIEELESKVTFDVKTIQEEVWLQERREEFNKLFNKKV